MVELVLLRFCHLVRDTNDLVDQNYTKIRVRFHFCEVCASGFVRPPGDYAPGPDTVCSLAPEPEPEPEPSDQETAPPCDNCCQCKAALGAGHFACNAACSVVVDQPIGGDDGSGSEDGLSDEPILIDWTAWLNDTEADVVEIAPTTIETISEIFLGT